MSLFDKHNHKAHCALWKIVEKQIKSWNGSNDKALDNKWLDIPGDKAHGKIDYL